MTLSVLNNRAQFLKKIICFCKSKFFPLRVDQFWKGFVIWRNKQEVTKVVPIGMKMVVKHACACISIHHEVSLYLASLQ